MARVNRPSVVTCAEDGITCRIDIQPKNFRFNPHCAGVYVRCFFCLSNSMAAYDLSYTKPVFFANFIYFSVLDTSLVMSVNTRRELSIVK